MKTYKFKALVAMNKEFVDEYLLYKGIYTTDKPALYRENETLEGVVEMLRTFKEQGVSIISDEYINNLEKCYLTDIELKLI